MTDNRKACEKCGRRVPADMLYPATTLRYGMVCGGCFHETRRIDQARQAHEAPRRHFFIVLFSGTTVALFSFVVLLIFFGIHSGYIRIWPR